MNERKCANPGVELHKTQVLVERWLVQALDNQLREKSAVSCMEIKSRNQWEGKQKEKIDKKATSVCCVFTTKTQKNKQTL